MRAIPDRPLQAAGLCLLVMALASPALADDDLRPLCPTRPGLATPPCIVDSGHVVAELGLADWTFDRQGGDRTDTLTTGDLLLRYGLGGRDEVQLGLVSFGTVRMRNASGVSHASGAGDLTLAYKHSLGHPDGNGFSVAVQTFVTLPTGGSAIGAGDWGGGLLIPMSVPLSDKVALELTPEIDASVNASGKGRHMALSAVEGLSFALSSKVSTSVEVEEVHDEDPSGAQDHALAGLSMAWQPSSNWQVDMGTVAGLGLNNPDLEVYFGISRRF
ncbi:MAG TPA: transporter [Sphingobium sp.]